VQADIMILKKSAQIPLRGITPIIYQRMIYRFRA
jgi:hypothetical protein